MVREIYDEIALNINILARFEKQATEMMGAGGIPVFIPYRMQMPWYRYFVLSGELRLLDIGKQRWILSAGMHFESFNGFIDNTETLLVSSISLPNGLKIATKRLNGLVKEAQEHAKNLSGILAELDVSKANKEETKGTNSNKEAES